MSFFAKIIACGLVLTSVLGSTTAGLPPNHPRSLFEDFGGDVRCPYAEKWMTKGPQQAAVELGLLKRSPQGHVADHKMLRRLQDVAGSCVYFNAFSGMDTCLEMRGTWTMDSMRARCATEDGTLRGGQSCSLSSASGGFCVLENDQGAIEATLLDTSATMGCAGLGSTCQSFLGGEFQLAGTCGVNTNNESGSETVDNSTNITTSPSVTCEIAPGPIGGAHQAAYSSGYSGSCPGTPGEGSPYQWPLRWTANVQSQSVPFGTDEVIFESRGKVYYALDNNWKRADTLYVNGIQRSIGQGPCPEDKQLNTSDSGPVLACNRTSEDQRTMIHRGPQMFFITWKNGTVSEDPADIDTCRWLDLQVVGNVRPDWFMDDRGDSSDTQYLGNQHIYYEGGPKLVKQWRKTDFADQYFVMSMQENAGEDGIHWPLVLNVPGEGFGDDFLQWYTNHSVLTEEDDYIFLLDQAFESVGGICVQQVQEGGVGPPTSDVEPIPSNLEVEPESWFSNMVTFSPVWEAPVREEVSGTGAIVDDSGLAFAEEGLVTVGSCYDSEAKAVKLSFTFNQVAGNGAELPWIALGYRQDDECLMIPRDGSDTEIILVATDSLLDVLTVSHGSMSPLVKGMSTEAVAGIYTTLRPLDEANGYSDIKLDASPVGVVKPASTEPSTLPEGTVKLEFTQVFDEPPEALYMMYAIGSSQELGYHSSRRCFPVTKFPSCSGDGSVPVDDASNETATSTSGAGVSTAMTVYSVGLALGLIALVSP